jgi:integrase
VQKQKTICSKKEIPVTKLKKEQQALNMISMRELIQKESEGIHFCHLVDQWYDSEFKEKRLNPNTLRDYHHSLKNWCTEIWKTPADKIKRQEILRIFKNLEENGISKSFQQSLKTVINHVLNWGSDEGLISIEKLPTKGISTKRTEEKLDEILTIEQVRTLLTQAKNLEHPWYPVWCFALLTGMRNGELYALKWEDISTENKMIKVSRSYNKRLREFKSTKSGDWRSVPINQELMELITKLRLQTYHTGFVLPRFRDWERGYQAKILRSFLVSIDLPSVRFHALRACFSTMLIAQGNKPIQIMKICGWKELKTMERYIRLGGIDEMGATDSLRITPKHQSGAILNGTFDR